MSRASWTRMRSTACVIALGTTVAATAGCYLEEGAAYPVVVRNDCISDEYIATTEPVYFEGRAAYLCGGAWYYREGGRWSHYDREPPALHEHRMRPPPS